MKSLILGAAFLVLFIAALPTSSCSSTTKRFEFNVEWKNVTRLCKTVSVLTVNGEYPGPTITVYEGDNVEIKVNNRGPDNTTIHWHGVKQLRTGWADGPAYVTQCPITKGNSYTYKFTISGQRGTLWWHAHYAWQRATAHGAFIIKPRNPYPFPARIRAGIPVILGEWWNEPVQGIEDYMKLTGDGPNSSNAYTINGLPGSLYQCSNKDTFVQRVEPGQTYMLRIINAALNQELFFTVENHTMTVVEIDAAYTKPFDTTAIMITPGQTTTVLLKTNQIPDSTDMFVMAARPYLTSLFPFNNSTSIGFLQYKTSKTAKLMSQKDSLGYIPSSLPEMEDTVFATKFTDNLRSLGTTEYPCDVPKQIDKRVITTVSLNLQDCPKNKTCKGLYGKIFSASMNNISFVRPTTSILEYQYRNLSNTTINNNFPEKPPHVFDYTGVDALSENMNSEFGTNILAVAYGTKLEIVLQDTGFMNLENHPIHIHGHNFYIVGTGFGNFNEAKDPANYNLVDPPERNTVGVPMGGWAAIRINADNPGVWFIHCHLEEHTSWGLAMGLMVKCGSNPSQCMLPPPDDFPSC
ncbi:laccase-1 isoform X2 [Apium graveolens]|uniref:laccase-1 isoform X2 n=1 Tax=Apium graveolens TaxID=4045 RepID=UPI003D7986B3